MAGAARGDAPAASWPGEEDDVAKIAVPWKALKGLGLGDFVKKAIQATGIKKEDCAPCDKRRQALNRFRLPK